MPPPKYFRLTPGREVRLRYGYFITCTSVVKNDKGEVVEVHCTYDPATRGGNSPDGRKVKSTIHWVSAQHAVDAEVRIYEHLFSKENPDDVEEGQRLHREPESAFAGSDLDGEAGTVAGECGRWARAISSSGWDISALIRIRNRASLCSTGRWR